MDPDPGQSPRIHSGTEQEAKAGDLAVEIVRRAAAWPENAEEDALLARAGRAAYALAAGRGGPAEVAVVLTDDAESRLLNRDWRGQDKATNALSFPLGWVHGPEGARRVLGDIVLAAATVEREASERGIPRAWHAAHLVAHGVLHLIGHDHETDMAAEAMEGLERRVMSALGLPDPYAAEMPARAASAPAARGSAS